MRTLQEYFALWVQRDSVFPRAPVDDAEDMKLDQGLDEFLSLFIGPAEEKACECALAPAFRAEHVDEFGPSPRSTRRSLKLSLRPENAHVHLSTPTSLDDIFRYEIP